MCPCSHRGAKTREENTITGGQEATLLAWHQPLSPQPSLQPRHAYSGKSETSPRVQPHALRPMPGLNQGRDNHRTQEKPNSVRVPCLAPWALNPPPKVWWAQERCLLPPDSDSSPSYTSHTSHQGGGCQHTQTEDAAHAHFRSSSPAKAPGHTKNA